VRRSHRLGAYSWRNASITVTTENRISFTRPDEGQTARTPSGVITLRRVVVEVRVGRVRYYVRVYPRGDRSRRISRTCKYRTWLATRIDNDNFYVAPARKRREQGIRSAYGSSRNSQRLAPDKTMLRHRRYGRGATEFTIFSVRRRNRKENKIDTSRNRCSKRYVCCCRQSISFSSPIFPINPTRSTWSRRPRDCTKPRSSSRSLKTRRCFARGEHVTTVNHRRRRRRPRCTFWC